MQKTTLSEYQTKNKNVIRSFKLSCSDIFSVPLSIFMKDSNLWNKDFKIMGFKKERIYIYWNYHKIPTPFKRSVVRLIYIKENTD